jgi:hypothetical protein
VGVYSCRWGLEMRDAACALLSPFTWKLFASSWLKSASKPLPCRRCQEVGQNLYSWACSCCTVLAGTSQTSKLIHDASSSMSVGVAASADKRAYLRPEV